MSLPFEFLCVKHEKHNTLPWQVRAINQPSRSFGVPAAAFLAAMTWSRCFFHIHAVHMALRAKRMHRAMLKPQMDFISKHVVLEAPAHT